MMRKNSGFTAIELLTVIVIISVLTAFAVPNYIQFLPNYRLKSAARDLYSNLQRAKIGAIKANNPCTVTFNTNPDRYLISCLNNKTVVLGNYGSGINFDGPGGQTFTDGTLIIDSRGMCDASESIYLSNAPKRAYYQTNALLSGVIQLRRWSGGTWTQSE